MRSTRSIFFACGLVALVSLLTLPVQAEAVQTTELAQQSLRPYAFVFLAYALAWILVFGWVVSVWRRLTKLDAHLRD